MKSWCLLPWTLYTSCSQRRKEIHLHYRQPYWNTCLWASRESDLISLFVWPRTSLAIRRLGIAGEILIAEWLALYMNPNGNQRPSCQFDGQILLLLKICFFHLQALGRKLGLLTNDLSHEIFLDRSKTLWLNQQREIGIDKKKLHSSNRPWSASLKQQPTFLIISAFRRLHNIHILATIQQRTF